MKQFQSFLRDQDLVDEVRRKVAAGTLKQASRYERDAFQRRLDPATARAFGTEMAVPAPDAPGLEAIVLAHGRPTLLVQNGTFALPESSIWQEALSLHKGNIESAIARVGRIELINHLNFEWVGTGWLIAENTIITNRHVAETFAEGSLAAGFGFRRNILQRVIGANIDFREEFEIDVSLTISVDRILYVAPDGEPDIAILGISSDSPLPEPLPLLDTGLEERQLIGVIGYPAFDTRNGLDDMRRIFGDIYDVKRFAPGKVAFPTEDYYFVHDCTTLGGNSGSSIIDLETGSVVGLHFSGSYLEGNFAIKVPGIKAALARTTTQVTVPAPHPDGPDSDGTHDPQSFTGRDGYRPDFLGGAPDLAVELPALGRWETDVARQPDGNPVLDYRHFSVIVSESRALPLLAAVNIDGAQARRAFRDTDQWFLDARIAGTAQRGNEVYKHNDLDRGHMVRRLDPVWGTLEEAQEANDDTFHYVNAAPQHKDLNRREWVNLEDYVLDSATARDLKVSVFSGPVLRDDDRIYRNLVRLPKEFWKIAVLVNSDTGVLAAAGYVLTQGTMIQDITEAAFVYGEFRTFQVPIARIEAHTGLDFGPLREADTLTTIAESLMVARARPIRGPRDIRFA